MITSTEARRYTVALVEDDEDLRASLANFFELSGLDCWSVGSAEDFYVALLKRRADLVVIDLGLPGEGGLSLLRRLSKHRLPAIILSARGQTTDRIEGLSAGALQYFIKPVDLDELVAGIRSLLSRLSEEATPNVKLGWRIERDSATLITPGQQSIPLTSRELDLIQSLLRTPNQLVTKAELLQVTNQHPDADFHRIESALQRLRKKTFELTNHTLPIRSVFGKGLVFAQ